MPIHDYIMSTYWLFLYCTLLMNYGMYYSSTSDWQNYNLTLKINFTLILNYKNKRQSPDNDPMVLPVIKSITHEILLRVF